MPKEDWPTSKDIVNFLSGRRANDVKVQVRGIYVPVAGIAYNPAADVFVITLDEDHEDYRIAMAADIEDE